MMRKFIMTFIFCLCGIGVIRGQEIKEDLCNDSIWNKLLQAIIYVESRGNLHAISSDGKSVGILQITPILVKDCNIYLKSKGHSKRYTLRDRHSREKSIEMFFLVQSRYNPERNIEKAIRLWNGGPKYSTKATQKYYERVMKKYKGENT